MRNLYLLASLFAAVFAAASITVVGPASAQLSDILLGPKTPFDRGIEARSSSNIARDNAIVIDANKVMAELGTIKASTKIYEQRLLVTGLFAEARTYRKFETGVRKIEGVKKPLLARYLHDGCGQGRRHKAGRMMDWKDVLAFETKAGARLIGTAGVADVNFRVTGDPFGYLYLLGRARSGEELKKAIAKLEDGDGVKKIKTTPSSDPDP